MRMIGLSLVLTLFLAGAAVADDAETQPTADLPVAADGAAGAFEALSPGNRRIAEALHESQLPAGGWSLDTIAAARRDGLGWGEIFHDLQADGAVAASTLGQALSAPRRQAAAPARDGADLARQATAVEPVPSTGAFDALSPGSQRIAEALRGAQRSTRGAPDADLAAAAWSLDSIAAARRDGLGWGEILHAMRADGPVEAGTLGPAAAAARQSDPSRGRAIVITDASGRHIVATRIR